MPEPSGQHASVVPLYPYAQPVPHDMEKKMNRNLGLRRVWLVRSPVALREFGIVVGVISWRSKTQSSLFTIVN